MSKKHRSTGTPKDPTLEAVELRTRRARTLLVLEASRAAIESYRDMIARECNAALELLAELEPFTNGGELPVRAERFAESLRHRMSTDEQTREDALEGICDLVTDCSNIAIADTAVLETFAQAVGVCDTPFEISLRRIRDQISESRAECGDYLRETEAAFRAPIGGSRSHSETLGGRTEETDPAVIASYEQECWLACALDARKRQRAEMAQQKRQVAHA